MDEHFDLPILDLAYGGAGIGRLDGLAVFVPGTVPGDVARVRLRSRRPRYAEGALVELIRPSPERVVSRCAHFGACGGCQWMSLPYETQLLHKEAQVRSAIERIGRIEGFVLHPIAPSPRVFGYRNRMEFAFGWGPEGLVLGLHRGDDPAVIEPIRECHLQDPAANVLLRLLLCLVREDMQRRESPSAVPRGDPLARGEGAQTGDGVAMQSGDAGRALQTLFVRRIALRKNEATGRFLAVLVTRPGAWPEGPALANRAMQESPRIGGVVRKIVSEDGHELAIEPLAGDERLRESVAGLALELPAGAFLQVNSLQTERLYRRAASFVAIGTAESVLDLYCGIGAMTILIGRAARRATGIERSRESVRSARRNARANAASHLRFFPGDAEHAAAGDAASGRSWDAVLVNPPRAGLPKGLVDSVARLAPSRIVYVSCDPATLARDLARFAARGYRTTDVAPFDLFPHTYHVETIARLERT